MLVPLGVAVLSSKYDEFDCLVFFFCTFLVSLSLVFFWFSSKKKKEKSNHTHTHGAPPHVPRVGRRLGERDRCSKKVKKTPTPTK